MAPHLVLETPPRLGARTDNQHINCSCLLCLQWKVAPALAAGNSIVLKPSEMASITCLELADLALQAGVPQGILNVVTGLGADAGAPLRYVL